MADHFVDDAAVGANDGATKTDAWTALESSAGVSAGDTVFVAHTHDQVETSTITIDWSNGQNLNRIKLLSIDFSDDSLTPGAKLSTTGASSDLNILSAGLYGHGFTFDSDDDMIIAAAQNDLVLEECALIVDDALTFGSVNHSIIKLLNVDIDLSASSSVMDIRSMGADFHMRGGSITRNNQVTVLRWATIDSAGRARANILFEELNLSGFTNLSEWKGMWTGSIIARRCEINASAVGSADSLQDNDEQVIGYENCDDGTITVPPLGITRLEYARGDVISSLSRYRTGGADDGDQANEHSWEMTTNADALEVFSPLEGPPLHTKVAGGSSLTFKIFVAGAATLNNDDFWIELHGPDDAGSATAKGHFESTRMAPQGTPAALTTDGSSTWNGTGVGTKQEVSITYTPTIAGPVTIRPFFAKPSATAYVDAKIDVS